MWDAAGSDCALGETDPSGRGTRLSSAVHFAKTKAPEIVSFILTNCSSHMHPSAVYLLYCNKYLVNLLIVPPHGPFPLYY